MAPPDEVDDGRAVAPLGHLAHVLDGDPRGGERMGRARGRDERGSRASRATPATSTAAGLSASRTERKAVPSVGSGRPAARSAFAKRRREIGGARHHLAGRAHLGAEHRVGAGEARERQHRGLHAETCFGVGLGREVELGERRARGEPAGGLDEVDAGRLAREGHGPRRARVRLEDEDLAVRRPRAGR